MDACSTETREMLEGEQSLELSFVELVIAASECSEDETEIADLVDGLIASGRVTLQAPIDLERPGHPGEEEECDLLDAA